MAEEIRKRVQEATQLTCSVGIAPNKMLAKICSDMNKPNGQTYMEPDKEKILDFMRVLSVRKIPGIGRMTELILASLGIMTCGDILEKAPEIFISFSEKSSRFLFRAALGISRNFHEEDEEDTCQKSISISTTFKPITKYELLKEKIKEICEELSERIDKRKVAGCTLTVEFKNTKFQVVQKSQSLKNYIFEFEDLFKTSMQIVDANWPCDPLRLVGVKLSNLRNQHELKKDKNLNDFFKDSISKEEYSKKSQN